MAAQIIDGKAVAAKVRGEVADEAKQLRARGVEPGLAVVLVGEDPASQVYVRNKTKAGRDAGLNVFDHALPASTSETELLALVERLNRDPNVDGILVQFPVPRQIDAQKVQRTISPEKDVDGLHPISAGRLWAGEDGFVPCTPLGVMRLLKESGANPAGADAVVLGRSNLVGKPMAALLLAANATVTMCHSKTRDLPEVVRRADIVVAAIGKPDFVRGDWIKPGATVLDVGMNKKPDGKLTGDVAFAEAAERARAITPVPGGVGPMTIALLLANTVKAARRRLR
jgi:methylenetetrahydrofolate dehydrogenase (NADP+)/methenyltetrahydrofolate cyclohydrolase